MNSDTPRTDESASDGFPYTTVCVTADFARNLERELNNATKQNLTLTKAMQDGCVDACVDSGEFTYNDWVEIRQRLLKEIEDLRDEIDRLIKTLP